MRGLLLMLWLLAAGGGDNAGGAEHPFTAEPLAEGVWLFRPAGENPGRANSLVILQRHGLVVIDAQPSPQAASELQAEIAHLTDAPVRYLVYSHPHADAVGGGSAFPDSTVVVASQGCHDALADPDFRPGAELGERIGVEAADAIERRLPDLVVPGTVTLADPDRPVELYALSHAHSTGDLGAALEQAGIYTAGDLLAGEGLPFARDSRLEKWLASINHLLRRQPAAVVPLHGRVLARDDLNRFRDALAWILGHGLSAYDESLTAAGLLESLADEPEFETYFGGVSERRMLYLAECVLEEGRILQRKFGRPRRTPSAD